MQLKNEFRKIDHNGDGMITANEMVEFLVQLSKGQIDTSIAEEIFGLMDKNGNGQVLIEEFVYAYYR